MSRTMLGSKPADAGRFPCASARVEREARSDGTAVEYPPLRKPDTFFAVENIVELDSSHRAQRMFSDLP